MALFVIGRRLPIVRDLSALMSMPSPAINLLTSVAAYSSSTPSDKTNNSTSNTNAGPGAAPSPVADTAKPTEQPAVTVAAETTPQASTSQPATREEDDEWTEVVHATGQTYYWNQRTGETTEIGEPKPEGRRGGGGGGGGRSSGAGGGEGTDHSHRAEAPLEDKTGTYAAAGLFIGAFLGWFSQFV